MLDKNLKWAPQDPEDVLSDELFAKNVDDGNEQMESEHVDEEINSMHEDIDDLKVEGDCEPDNGYERFDNDDNDNESEVKMNLMSMKK